MHMHDTFNIRPRLIEPSVDEDFLRHIQAVVARQFLAVEIDGDDIARAHETQTRFLGPARFDENFVLARHARADVAAGLFCKVKFAEDTARLGNQLAQLCLISHKNYSPLFLNLIVTKATGS